MYHHTLTAQWNRDRFMKRFKLPCDADGWHPVNANAEKISLCQKEA
jgi:hypothetical protein